MSQPVSTLLVFLLLLFIAQAAAGKIPEIADLSTFGLWAVIFGAAAAACVLSALMRGFAKPLAAVALVLGLLSYFVEKLPDNFNATRKTQAQLAAALEVATTPAHYLQLDPAQHRALDRFVARCAVLSGGSSLGLKSFYDGVMLTPQARSLPTIASEVVGWMHAHAGQALSLDCSCPARTGGRCR